MYVSLFVDFALRVRYTLQASAQLPFIYAGCVLYGVQEAPSSNLGTRTKKYMKLLENRRFHVLLL